jgi:hypothetical protein
VDVDEAVRKAVCLHAMYASGPHQEPSIYEEKRLWGHGDEQGDAADSKLTRSFYAVRASTPLCVTIRAPYDKSPVVTPSGIRPRQSSKGISIQRPVRRNGPRKDSPQNNPRPHSKAHQHVRLHRRRPLLHRQLPRSHFLCRPCQGQQRRRCDGADLVSINPNSRAIRFGR